MALPSKDQRYSFLRFEGLEYIDVDIVYFKGRLGKIYDRGIHRVLVFDFEELTKGIAEGLSTRILMEHTDAQGHNPLLRLCHKLIACSIAGRSQAPEKVTLTDLFYLRSIDVGLGDTWAWVAPGLERQPDAAARALKDVKCAHAEVEGVQRISRLEEEVHELRESLDKQREVMEAMAIDFSRFTVWAASGISQLLDLSGATYTRMFKPRTLADTYCLANLQESTNESRTKSKPVFIGYKNVASISSGSYGGGSLGTMNNNPLLALPAPQQTANSGRKHGHMFVMAVLVALDKEEEELVYVAGGNQLSTLPLDELIGNLKVYEMVLDNDGVASKITKEKVKSLAFKAKVVREQTSDDSDSQDESDEEVDEEEAEAFNLLARNFRKFFRKGNQFGRGNRFGNGKNIFEKGRGNNFGNKGGESSNPKGACYNYEIGHFASECRKPKENKAFVGSAWSDSEDGDKQLNDETCLMAIDSQEALKNENLKLSSKSNDFEIEVKKLASNKEVVEPCKNYDVLTKEVDFLKCNISNLQDEALNFSKFKSSSIALDDMLSHQKLSQDKEGLGFSKNDKNTYVSPNKPIVFVKQSQKENASTSFVKLVVPQTHFANTQGLQAPIRRVEITHQDTLGALTVDLDYTLASDDPRPLFPTPHMRPSNSYARRPSFQNNHSSRGRYFYQNQSSSHHQPRTSQREENSYQNQRLKTPWSVGPNLQNSYDFQNNPWSAFSRCVLNAIYYRRLDYG
ncbi:hypothetical protein Tco_0105431 [Tanacetum coccineum]